MDVTRRAFFARSVAGLALAVRSKTEEPEPFFDVASLPRYVDPLPIPRTVTVQGKCKLAMREFSAKVHRDLPPTTMWGYDGSSPGPVIEARSGRPVSFEWVNQLPTGHLLPLDHTLHGAEADKPLVRTVVHLHGGRVSPDSDGYPENWIVPGQSQITHYNNQQEPAALFYHDHAMGITRLNTAAGLMGLYIIRDEAERSFNLPHGEYEIPLVIVDRSFYKDGRLFYPVSQNPEKPWVSEYYGAGILANGKLAPYFEVQPRKYRFRVLNSSNGSFYVLAFAKDNSYASNPESFLQIGTDQGFLAAPQNIATLILGPGERVDLIFDFAPHRGQQIYLRTKSAYVMQFRVSRDKVDDRSLVPASFRPIRRIAESESIRTRELTLADYQDRLGNSRTMLLNGMHWDMPVTEKPDLGSTEIWSFINLTDDSHPIHLHLVRFQILDRTPFDVQIYSLTKKIVF
ncbi:MAG: multicopper oxidase domain-containing protein, partial [Acidobacteriaceae bacterium]|nr:multicopper oxidase domain-containing protein [Acidobacteriaceae bacterium]